jgi:hypothetical protein
MEGINFMLRPVYSLRKSPALMEQEGCIYKVTEAKEN